MANGTIAFDTLSTSDAVNTGTTKSIDTSYIFNGVSKAWYQLDGTGTIGMNDSFNMTTTTDHGTGEYTTTFTNAMSNDDYAFLFGGSSQSNIGSNGHTTTTLRLRCRAGGDNSALDLDPITCGVNGDLA